MGVSGELAKNGHYVPYVWKRKTIFSSVALKGGERRALLYRLIGICRQNGIDPKACIRYILSVLPEWLSNKVAELLSWNVNLHQ